MHPSTTYRTDSHRLRWLYEAVDRFDVAPELTKRVYHLGIPRFTDTRSTAAISIIGDQILFEFNRGFFDKLSQEELIFVLLHEALHYGLRHPQRCQERIPAIWNIACDVVTNALLVNKFGFDRVTKSSFRKFLQSAITFETLHIVPKEQQSKVTAEEVYRLLEKSPKRVSDNSETLQACDEHAWVESYPTGTLQEVDLTNALTQQAERLFREYIIPVWDHHASGELRFLQPNKPLYCIEWGQLLWSRITSCLEEIVEQRGAPPNRRISWIYPTILLPDDRFIEKPWIMVLLAIDSSGSISPPILDKLIAIARSIPQKKVKLSAISFDTRTYPINLFDNSKYIYGGGGTSFNAVETFVGQLKPYPDLIIVLTDGIAPRPQIRFPERWFWLITADGTTQNIEGIGGYCRIT